MQQILALSTKQLHRSQAFTLIELMLVVFIVGMMATGISIVSTTDRLPKLIADESRQLQASIRQLQSMATIHQQLYGLSFSEAGWRLMSIEPDADFMQWGTPQAGKPTEEETLGRFAGINAEDEETQDKDGISWNLIPKKNNKHSLSKKLELELFLGDTESEILGSNEIPQILFSAQGGVTPFFILFRGVNSDVEIMIEVTNAGDILRPDLEELKDS